MNKNRDSAHIRGASLKRRALQSTLGAACVGHNEEGSFDSLRSPREERGKQNDGSLGSISQLVFGERRCSRTSEQERGTRRGQVSLPDSFAAGGDDSVCRAPGCQ